jgi:hypothetical protein
MLSKEIILKNLKNLRPLKYNQFRWWRNFDVPKTLPKTTFIEERIDNGDFEPSPYFWMAQLVLWEKENNNIINQEPFERVKRGTLLMKKYECLLHDFEKDDKDRLDNFIDAIYNHFEVDKDKVEEEIKEFGSTIKDYYIFAKQKYVVRRTYLKKRGRPKK